MEVKFIIFIFIQYKIKFFNIVKEFFNINNIYSKIITK